MRTHSNVDNGLVVTVILGLAVGIAFIVVLSSLNFPVVPKVIESPLIEGEELPPNTVLTLYGLVDCGQPNLEYESIKLCSEVYQDKP
jgi:hypothetical protein